MNISWKNVLQIPTNWNTDKRRMSHIGKLGQLYPRLLYFIDECGFNMNIKKSKGRTLKR